MNHVVDNWLLYNCEITEKTHFPPVKEKNLQPNEKANQTKKKNSRLPSSETYRSAFGTQPTTQKTMPQLLSVITTYEEYQKLLNIIKLIKGSFLFFSRECGQL